MLFLWFIFIVAIVLSSFFCWCLFFSSWCDTWSALVSKCKTLSLEFLNSLRNHFPWFHGITDNMTGGISLRCLSDGYFYINLPPIFMFLLSFVLMYLSKENAILLYMLLFSLTKNTWPQRASPAVNPLYLHAAVGERIIVYVSLFQSD